MSTPRPAVQIYALKDPWAVDHAETLQRIAALGLEGVEAFSLGDVLMPRATRLANARAVGDEIRAAGLELTGAHTTLPPEGDADWMFEEMTTLGSPFAIASTTERVLGFTRDALADADRIPRFADRLNGLAERGRRHGVRIGYHNHYWEWADVDGTAAFDRLVALLDPEIALEIDLFWAYSAGRNLPELIRQYDDRIEFVHVKDGDGVLGAPQVVSGTGDVPLEDALATATNVRWEVLELDVIAADADVWDVVAGSADWLRSRRN